MNLNNCLLKVNNLSFERADRKLFRDLTFSVDDGIVLQVVGANGVGKTTLLRILAGFIPIDQGEVHWCGQSIHRCPANYRAELAYLGHQSGITLGLTPRENLRMMVALHSVNPRMNESMDNNSSDDFLRDIDADNNTHLSHIDKCLEQFDLLAQANTPAMHLSAGQQRRLAFAALPMRNAKLWILDEPFTALDQKGVEQIEQLLFRHTQQGGSVIIATHQAIKLASLRLQLLELGL